VKGDLGGDAAVADDVARPVRDVAVGKTEVFRFAADVGGGDAVNLGGTEGLEPVAGVTMPLSAIRRSPVAGSNRKETALGSGIGWRVRLRSRSELCS
jgi:hypothetical protein